MTDRKKNLFVGSTVLAGLIVLGWMVLKFGNIAISPFTNGRAMIIVRVERAEGVGEGSPVQYRGMNVGQVRSVRLADDMTSVVLTLAMNSDAHVPANVEPIIRQQGYIGGNAAVVMEIVGPAPTGRLVDGAELRGRAESMELLPPEFKELAADLKRTSQEFRESGVLKHLDEAIVNISQQASRAGDVMESVNKLVGDEAMTRDLRLSMQQVREATATANAIAKDLQKFSGTLERTGTNLDRLTSEATETVRDARGMVKTTQGNIDQITRQISDRLTQVSVLLDTTHSVARKLDQGKGSAGLLVNDPKLYEALVDSAKQLNVTLTDLQRLVEQWEQEGITFRVN